MISVMLLSLMPTQDIINADKPNIAISMIFIRLTKGICMIIKAIINAIIMPSIIFLRRKPK